MGNFFETSRSLSAVEGPCEFRLIRSSGFAIPKYYPRHFCFGIANPEERDPEERDPEERGFRLTLRLRSGTGGSGWGMLRPLSHMFDQAGRHNKY